MMVSTGSASPPLCGSAGALGRFFVNRRVRRSGKALRSRRAAQSGAGWPGSARAEAGPGKHAGEPRPSTRLLEIFPALCLALHPPK